eukprot:scaffold20054_cov125-Isochrysis_galbana.AAC.8
MKCEDRTAPSALSGLLWRPGALRGAHGACMRRPWIVHNASASRKSERPYALALGRPDATRRVAKGGERRRGRETHCCAWRSRADPHAPAPDSRDSCPFPPPR